MTDLMKNLLDSLARPSEVHFWDDNHRYVIGRYISTVTRGPKKGWIRTKLYSGKIVTIDPAKLRFPVKL